MEWCALEGKERVIQDPFLFISFANLNFCKIYREKEKEQNKQTKNIKEPVILSFFLGLSFHIGKVLNYQINEIWGVSVKLFLILTQTHYLLVTWELQINTNWSSPYLSTKELVIFMKHLLQGKKTIIRWLMDTHYGLSREKRYPTKGLFPQGASTVGIQGTPGKEKNFSSLNKINAQPVK